MLGFEMRRRVALPIACAALMVAGCSSVGLGNDKIDYRSAKPVTRGLEVPPELSQVPPTDRFNVPGSATASASASATQATARPAPSGAPVAPAATNARIEKTGDQRWLVVDVPPEQAYAVVRDFWPSVGLALERDDPALGILETVWSENRAKLPQDIIRRAIGSVLDGIYSTGERDRFRTRIERTPKNTAEIYISHRGMVEVYTNQERDFTRWQPRPSDPELEAEMLQRLMLRFAPAAPTMTATAASGTPQGAATPAATPAGSAPAAAGAAPAAAGTAAPSAAAATQTVRLVREGGSAQRVEIDEPFDRAWRRVGLGLDRGAFTVEDRDRANGIYFVRYLDPEVEAKQRGEQGIFSKMFGSDPKIVAPQYRVQVATSGNTSVVTVQDKDGKPEVSPIGERILTLLSQQLR